MTLFTIKTEKKIFTTKNSLLNLEDSTKEEEENSNKILYITEKVLHFERVSSISLYSII